MSVVTYGELLDLLAGFSDSELNKTAQALVGDQCLVVHRIDRGDGGDDWPLLDCNEVTQS